MLEDLIDNENASNERKELINKEVFIPPQINNSNEKDKFMSLEISTSSVNEEYNSYYKDLALLMLSYIIIYFLPIVCFVINLIFLALKLPTNLSFEILEVIGASNLYINVFFTSICFGINFPLDYLGGNAFGSNKLRVFGKIFLVSIIFTFSISLIAFMPSFFIGTKLLNLFMSSAESKKELDQYFYLSLITGFLQVNLIPNVKYLIIGRKLLFLIISNLVVLVLNITLNAVFIIVLDFKLQGCAYANISTFGLLYLITFFYIFVFKPYPESNIGLSTKDGSYFSSYILSSLPSILLTFLMTLANETISVFLLNKNEQDFSAFVIQNIISSSILIISISIESAMAVIISEKDPKYDHKLIFKKILPFSFLINFLIVFALCAVTMILSSTLSSFFNVVNSVFLIYKANVWLFIGYTLLQSNINIFHGCFRGIGKFLAPNIINICLIVLINVPLAYVFIYILDMNLKGVWISLLSCSGLNLIILLIVLIVISSQFSRENSKED